MISVAQAQAALLALVKALPFETVDLRQAHGRVLAADQVALRDQPPFAASAMDGYAVADKTPPAAGTIWNVIGESAAGRGYAGAINGSEAVRIFTGAPLPQGAHRIIIQEDVTRAGDVITLATDADTGVYVRPAGTDFAAGFTLPAPRVLCPQDLALLAAMNIAQVPVTRAPEVAIISTGDELVNPGDAPGPDQIIASNGIGLAAAVEAVGAKARLLPIAKDTVQSLQMALRLAEGADLILTSGGASVGDHDLVQKAAHEMGLERQFYKVAMRPGKPLMAGRLNGAAMVGLPGNPVSAMVCAKVFVVPMIRKMLGLTDILPQPQTAVLAHDLPQGGPRQHYMRARVDQGQATVFDRQDSALLTVLSQANALAIRPPHAPKAAAGTQIEYLPM